MWYYIVEEKGTEPYLFSFFVILNRFFRFYAKKGNYMEKRFLDRFDEMMRLMNEKLPVKAAYRIIQDGET